MDRTFAVAIGGAAGQGVATPGDIFAKIFARRGLHLNAYNAYQSIIRGGHTFLTIRAGIEEVTCFGDRIDLLIPLNQDSMDRHLGLMKPGSAVVYNADTIRPGPHATAAQLCPLPVNQLSKGSRSKVEQNTLALGASLKMMGVGFEPLTEILTEQFMRKGDKVVTENLNIARLGYDYAAANFLPFASPIPMSGMQYAVLSGNIALAMGGAAAGVKFYCAYPMSPSTGVLHWMAAHAREAGIMVRQVEDEIGVINMAIGAAHATKTEQGDLWQMLGAGFGDFPRLIAAPTDIADCFKLVPEMHNLADRFQCPGIILGDLLLSEGRSSVDPKQLNFDTKIDRGEMIVSADPTKETNGYKRYKITQSGISPRAIPGVPGHTHTAATDEHDEDGVLISDEFTNPAKRRAMMEKRQRKVSGIEAAVELPALIGPPDADVTLVGWGSTKGVIREAVAILNEEGISTNQLQIRWLVPLHGKAILNILELSKYTIIVENNYSGQFARYLRSETSYVPNGYIRKYDGEPFMPHHIVEAVKEQLASKTHETQLSVPVHEILV